MEILTLAIMGVIIVIVGTITMFVLLIVLAKRAAKNKQQATNVQSGTIEHIVAGDPAEIKDETPSDSSRGEPGNMGGVTLIKTLVNVSGYQFQRGETNFDMEVGVTLPDTQVNSGETKTYGGKVYLVPVRIRVFDAIIPINRKAEKKDDGSPAKKPGPIVGFLEELQKFHKMGFSEYLEREFGFFWVSIWYPLKRVYMFPINHFRLLEQPTGDGSAADNWVKDGGTRPTSFLLWQFPRPVVIKGVEFRGGYTADFVLMATLQVVMSERPVFVLQGNFFPQIIAAIRAAMIDYCREQDLLVFIQQVKTGYAGDFYARVMSRINISASAMERLVVHLTNFKDEQQKENWLNTPIEEKPEDPRYISSHTTEGEHGSGTIPEFGIFVRKAWVHHVVPDKKALEMIRALQDATMKGNALITAKQKEGESEEVLAKGKAAAILQVSRAEADGLGLRIDAAKNQPEALLAQLQVERVRAFGGNAYAEGGSNASFMVQTGERPPKNGKATPLSTPEEATESNEGNPTKNKDKKTDKVV